MARELELPDEQVSRVRVRRRSPRHRQNRRARRDPAQAGPADTTTSTRRCASIPRSAGGSSAGRHSTTSGDGSSPTTRRPDGQGYPSRLTDDEIPVEAKILAVADAYEAMTSDRVYRKAIGAQAARNELERCSGSPQFDPEVVAAFLRALDGAGTPSAPSAGRSSRPRVDRRYWAGDVAGEHRGSSSGSGPARGRHGRFSGPGFRSARRLSICSIRISRSFPHRGAGSAEPLLSRVEGFGRAGPTGCPVRELKDGRPGGRRRRRRDPGAGHTFARATHRDGVLVEHDPAAALTVRDGRVVRARFFSSAPRRSRPSGSRGSDRPRQARGRIAPTAASTSSTGAVVAGVLRHVGVPNRVVGGDDEHSTELGGVVHQLPLCTAMLPWRRRDVTV